jgi:protein-S-isoprenylcysteine O-methyltransferase Ste14
MKRFALAAMRPGMPQLVRFDERPAPRTLTTAAGATGLSVGLGDMTARMVIVALFTMMAVRIGSDFLQTARLTGLLLLASEGLVVILTMFRRPTGVVNRSVRARILMVVSLIGPVLVAPASNPALLPEAATVAVSACGLLVVIIGKLSLGRSFGLMPANRGVVSTGLYRVVRHPIYMGYLVTHAAYCAANPTLVNLLILLVADLALLIRAVCEEETLALDGAYREYQQRVRWRVLPGVF